MNNHTIRIATASDLEAINAIYNHFVATSTCTYQEQPDSMQFRREWFAQKQAKAFPVTVATLDQEIVGWGRAWDVS